MSAGLRRTALCLLALLTISVARAQQPSPASPQNASEEKKGTGIVPPGVKLDAQEPAPGPPPVFHFPQAATKTLANGIRVFVVPDTRNQGVSIHLVLPTAGTIHDPAGVPGVADMTADMLTQGTEKRTAQQIAEAIDFVGGTISASADSDSTDASVTVVKKDFALAMDLLSDVVLHPAFKAEELERRRQQLLSNLQVEYADPAYLVGAVFSRVVYGASPYGLPEEGTPDSAKKLDRDTLIRFHDAYYTPEGALLAFAGDVTPEEAFAAAEKYFGGWTTKGAPVAALLAPVAAKGLHVYLIDKPDAVQTQISIGRLGIARNSPDYVPLVVTNRIFGGGYNSRLNTEVRIHKGLTYGARSAFVTHRFAGSFAASTYTRTEATVETTKLVLDLLAKMGSGEVSEAEMNFARDYLAGVYPIQSETPEQVAGRVLVVAEYGLPADFNSTYPQRILGVTAAEVKAMAARYFDTANLDLVLVGNVAKFREDLKKAVPNAQWTEIPFDQLDLLAPDLHKVKPKALEITPETLAQGKQILLAAAAAAGGDALTKLTGLEVHLKGTLFTPQGELAVEVDRQVSYPDHSHSVSQLGGGQIQTGFDGKEVWLASPQGAGALPEDFVAEFQREIALNGGWGLYRDALAGKVQAVYAGEEVIEGKKAQAVVWQFKAGPVQLYFDPDSHLMVAARFRALMPAGPAETELHFGDFRSVEGLQYPFHQVTYRGGAKTFEGTAEKVTLNPKLDPSNFTMPPPPKP